MNLPRVTVIVVANVTGGRLDERLERPLDGPVLAAIKSIEEQTHPKDLVDLSIVRNVDGYPVQDMWRFAAERATTEMVAFIREDDVWHSTTLSRACTWLMGKPEVERPDGTLLAAWLEHYLAVTA